VTRLIVVDRPERWPFEIPGAQVVAAREYLTWDRWAGLGRATTLNFCRSYAKNTSGYYLSLLARARGHRPIPSVTTLHSLLVGSVVRVVSEELDGLIQSGLRSLRSERFELSVYFGRNTARRYDRLSRELFNHFPVPFLRARFERDGDEWSLVGIRAIPASEVPESYHDHLNRPYRGWTDGLVTVLRGHDPVERYRGLELEVSQRQAGSVESLGHTLARGLYDALRGRKT